MSDIVQRVLAPNKAKRSLTGDLLALNDNEHKDLQDSLKGIVQVFLQAVEPNFSEPWTKSLPESSSGSGFIIDLKLRLIVTNAHCVDYHRTILLRKHGDHTQYEARLLTISHQVDLAILTVEEEKFWNNADCVSFGDVVRMQQVVDIVGYPIGGDTVSISRGVVSRIDWIPYAQSGGEGQICVQVDAAINPGNSGGPALCNGKVVGVAFQGMSSDEAANVGYIIPVTIIKKVLADFKASATKKGIIIPGYSPPAGTTGSIDDLLANLEDLSVIGDSDNTTTNAENNTTTNNTNNDKPMKWPPSKRRNGALIKLQSFGRFAVKYQTAENPYFRKYVKLPNDLDGVVIRSVSRLSNLYKVFQANDVLIAIDGKSVGNEGKIYNTLYSTTMDLQYVISGKLVGESIDFTICRDGQIIDIKSQAENPPRRIPLICKDPAVSYVMFCGLVFSPLSADSDITEEPIANILISKEAETLLLSKGNKYKNKSQQCVILTSLLPHRLTIGYSGIGQYTPIWKVNDTLINKTSDIAIAIASAKDELITFTFCDENIIVLPLKEGLKATWEIQRDFGMMSAMSKNIENILLSSGVELGIEAGEDEPEEETEKDENNGKEDNNNTNDDDDSDKDEDSESKDDDKNNEVATGDGDDDEWVDDNSEDNEEGDEEEEEEEEEEIEEIKKKGKKGKHQDDEEGQDVVIHIPAKFLQQKKKKTQKK